MIRFMVNKLLRMAVDVNLWPFAFFKLLNNKKL